MSTIKYTLGPGFGGIGEGNISLKAVANFESGGTVIDAVLSNPNSPCYVQELYLANGWTTVSVPNPASIANCAGVVIVPPRYNSAITVKLREGGGAGSGIPLSRSAPTLLAFDSTPPASIDLNWNGRNYQNTAVTLTNATDLVNLAAHGLVQNEVFRFVGGTLPAELAIHTNYYVTATIAAGTFQIGAVAGGVPILFSTDGASVKIATQNLFQLFWF